MTERTVCVERVRGSFVDRVVAALAAAGTALTTGQLIARAAGAPAMSVRSAVQKLAADDRLVRTDRNRWALAATGATPYTELRDAAATAAPEVAPAPRRRRPGPAPSADLLRPPAR